MSDSTDLASYQFFSWVRGGVAQAIGPKDTLDDSMAPTASLAVELDLQDAASGGTQHPSISASVLGPGDALGFDANVIVRTVPPAGTVGFEANHFAAIEFSHPELPWLMTPAAPNGEQLRPWICLAVVPQTDGVSLTTGTDGKHTLTAPATALPDLSQSWAWAHVQAVAADGASIQIGDLMSSSPQSVLSRLVCPTQLAPLTRYWACVVPTFDIGAQAGLGKDVSTVQTLAPAWTATNDPVTLPVYFFWEFSTTDAGDFGTLVKLLKPRPLAATVGLRTLDVSDAGFGLPASATIQMPGVLKPPGTSVPAWTDSAFQSALTPVLDTQSTSDGPVLAPPIYGRWLAATPTLSAARTPPWLYDLNLDPRYRAFAGAGARVVEEQQEDFLATAWAQLGDVKQANHLLRIAQLTRGALGALAVRRLAQMGPDERLAVTSPLHAHVPIVETFGTTPQKRTVTLEDTLRRSPIADAVKPAVRRATWPRRTPSLRNGVYPSSGSVAAASALLDGRAFLFGYQQDGVDNPASEGIPVSSVCWIYDDRRRTMSAVKNIPATLEWEAERQCCLLSDGRIFVNDYLFDPTNDSFSATASCPIEGQSVGLIDGGIAVTRIASIYTAPHQFTSRIDVAIYDSGTETWTLTQQSLGSTSNVLSDEAAIVQLLDGRILIVSGSSGAFTINVATKVWTATGPMVGAHVSNASSLNLIFGCTLLKDGRVLVSGGAAGVPSKAIADCEVFDPASNAWASVTSMLEPTSGDSTVVLGDGRVLSVGDSSEIYDPVVDNWSVGPTPSKKLYYPKAIVLSTGRVLVVDSTSFDLLSFDAPPATTVQPVSANDYFSDAGHSAAQTATGTAGASVNGALTYPNANVVSAVSGTPAGWPNDGDSASLFQAAAQQHLTSAAAIVNPPAPTVWSHGSSDDETAALVPSIGPERTTFNVAAARIDLVATRPAPPASFSLWNLNITTETDPLQPIVDGPDIGQAMYSSLSQQSADFVLPGIADIPDNTLALLETTPAAIEAYLVGLNSALNQMLVWRGYPTDQRGTAFCQFWDSGVDASAATPDIDPVTAWPAGNSLGASYHEQSKLVLLVRGQLLKRYPDAMVYAVQAVWSADKKYRLVSTVEQYPVYRATLAPDLTFLGFDLTFADAVGGDDPNGPAGWYFVIQQKPTAPVFGPSLPALTLAGPPAATVAVSTLISPKRVIFHAETMKAATSSAGTTP